MCRVHMHLVVLIELLWYKCICGMPYEEVLDSSTGVQQMYSNECTLVRDNDQCSSIKHLHPGHSTLIGSTAERDSLQQGFLPSITFIHTVARIAASYKAH